MGAFDVTVAAALHGLVGAAAGLDHVVVDAGIGVAVGTALVAVYVVFLRRTREEEGDSRPEAARSERRDA